MIHSPRELIAVSVAPASQTWLQDTTSAKVLHVFERAANLINANRDVLSLVTAEIGPEPFAIVVASDEGDVNFAGLFDAGDEVTVRGNALSVGRLSLDVSKAGVWGPRPRWEQLAGQTDALSARLPLLKELLAQHAPPGSFAPLLNASADDTLAFASFETRFLDAARQPAQALRDGILAVDMDACREAARGLAGLGSGLTPSGDDFMIGAMYALWATRTPAQIIPVAEAIVSSAVPHTVPLSAAWLRAAARGEAGQLWHALVETLADPSRQDELAVVARAIIRVGHSSGADALTGFIYLLDQR